MSVKTKIVRPKNLSQWVFFGETEQPNVRWSIGGDLSYINLIRSNHRPIIFIRQNNRGKYRWEVCIDLVEGFSDRRGRVKLSSDASRLVFNTMYEVDSIKLGYGSTKPFDYIGYAKYSSLEDAVNVANRLAALPASAYVCFSATA